jgi:hypothetical protein
MEQFKKDIIDLVDSKIDIANRRMEAQVDAMETRLSTQLNEGFSKLAQGQSGVAAPARVDATVHPKVPVANVVPYKTIVLPSEFAPLAENLAEYKRPWINVSFDGASDCCVRAHCCWILQNKDLETYPITPTFVADADIGYKSNWFFFALQRSQKKLLGRFLCWARFECVCVRVDKRVG